VTRAPRTIIAGLDLSLSRSAAVVGRLYRGAVDAVDTEVWTGADGLSEMDRIHASVRIADGIVAWLEDRKVSHVWIEGYAYSRSGRATHVLAEHGGIVRARIGRSGIAFSSAEQTDVRKWLLGDLKRTAPIKDRVRAELERRGLKFDSEDEYDAAAVMLWGAHCFEVASSA
jgi:Holliday junction resolvasome RuvABC endonuclease subunit